MEVSTRQVVLLGFEGVELLDLTGPLSVLTTANEILKRTAYQCLIASPGGRTFRGPQGALQMSADLNLDELSDPVDTVIVPGGLVALRARAPEVVQALARVGPQARRVAAICTGALFLAEAGLLADRRATTHWSACSRLQRLAPGCRVDREAVYVEDGPIWTSAGASAGIDLAVAMVEQDHHAEVAQEVAKWLVMYVRRSSEEAQLSPVLLSQRPETAPLQRLVRYLETHLAADLSLEAMSARARISPRQLSRLFKAQLGTSPAEFVKALRLEGAKRDLLQSNRSVKEIAARNGFGTVESLQRAFRRAQGLSPVDFRRAHGAPGP